MTDTEMSTKNGGSNPWITVVIVALAALAGGYYFINNKSNTPSTLLEGSKNEEITESSSQASVEKENNSTNDIVSPATSESDGAMVDEKGVRTIDMEGGSFYFRPDKITVKEGNRIKIVLKSVDKIHNFYLDEFNVKGPNIKSGETKPVEFTASKKGTYEFYCQIGQHRQMGMVGTLIVE